MIPGSPCKLLGLYPPFWKTTGNAFALLCPEERPVLGTLDEHPLDVITDGEVRMQVAVNGNVSIGAQDPDDQFEVHTVLERSGIAINNAREDANAHTEIRFMKDGVGRWALGSDLEGDGGQDFFLWDQQADLNRLRVDADGRVLIGNAVAQSSSLYKLYVEGGIVSRDVKVTAENFPDYVFDAGYTLMPLDELKKYIHVNGHLPNFPSAEEVKANEGVEVGDLQLRLLRTVEEQQLYILRLHEELTAMKVRLAHLEAQR